MKTQFLHVLQEVFGGAIPANNILILEFGHGDECTKGLAIGVEVDNDSMPLTDDLLPNLLTPAGLRLVLGEALPCQVTLFLNICFSGVWTKSQWLHGHDGSTASMMTAAE